MARDKHARPDEWKSKPSKMRIAAMRIVWGDAPITPVRSRKRKSTEETTDQNVWYVPSETTGDRYTVNLEPRTCTCPYWRERKTWCKHLEAGRIWKAKIQLGIDPAAVIGLEPAPNPYKQEPWYDALIAREEVIMRELVRCLGERIGYSKSGKKGQPKVPLGDLLACGIMGGYLNRPSRRAIPIHAVEDKLVRRTKPPSHQLLRKAMKNPELMGVCRDALRQIALCTSKKDTVFSIDATVMKTPLSQIHLQRRANGIVAVHKILNCKVHLVIGIDTFVVYGVVVTDQDVHDTNAFLPAMEQFQDFVRLDAMLADAGYCDIDHYEHVGKRGGKAFIDFTDIAGRDVKEGADHYNWALTKWRTQDDEWLNPYGMRWLSESANSSFKRTVKRVIRARLEQARETEALMAVLAFSLKWLMHARAKYGAEVEIPWADAKAVSMIDEVVEKCAERRLRRLPKAA